MPTPTPFQQAADLIAQADSLIVAAGAGMGVDSELPDFRGTQGFWRAYPALARAQVQFEQVASPASFERDPRLGWGFYGHRLALYRRTVPHEGFTMLRRWGEAKARGYGVFTSNVDGQFQKAGFVPNLVHECHGSILHLQCMEPCSDAIWEADAFAPEVDEETGLLSNAPPRCPRCGGLARPNVLMFGDWGWVGDRSAAQARRMEQWLATLERPVVVELGAGTAIPSVRHFSEQVLRRRGGALVRINPRECEVPAGADRGRGGRAVGLACGGLEGLREIELHSRC